jgi:hypothetical protein
MEYGIHGNKFNAKYGDALLTVYKFTQNDIFLEKYLNYFKILNIKFDHNFIKSTIAIVQELKQYDINELFINLNKIKNILDEPRFLYDMLAYIFINHSHRNSDNKYVYTILDMYDNNTDNIVNNRFSDVLKSILNGKDDTTQINKYKLIKTIKSKDYPEIRKEFEINTNQFFKSDINRFRKLDTPLFLLNKDDLTIIKKTKGEITTKDQIQYFIHSNLTELENFRVDRILIHMKENIENINKLISFGVYDKNTNSIEHDII